MRKSGFDGRMQVFLHGIFKRSIAACNCVWNRVNRVMRGGLVGSICICFDKGEEYIRERKTHRNALIFPDKAGMLMSEGICSINWERKMHIDAKIHRVRLHGNSKGLLSG